MGMEGGDAQWDERDRQISQHGLSGPVTWEGGPQMRERYFILACVCNFLRPLTPKCGETA